MAGSLCQTDVTDLTGRSTGSAPGSFAHARAGPSGSAPPPAPAGLSIPRNSSCRGSSVTSGWGKLWIVQNPDLTVWLCGVAKSGSPGRRK